MTDQPSNPADNQPQQSDAPGAPVQPAAPAPVAPPPAATAQAAKPLITYDDFAKLDLRVGKVIEVADHPNADKLLVLKVDLGGGQVRQILAGLRQYMPHEALLGREVVVVANLAPRKMRGLESQGMVLAATEDQGGQRKVVAVTTASPVPPGSQVS
jgi:methionyl-tRNA synthetase